jgi:hypothetical protein
MLGVHQAEIEDLHDIVLERAPTEVDVGRLDVAMDDGASVR